ncbi:hypothetical protein LWI28_018289 [Acer negundo]|uniref:Brix domain-containing protein n=1 Tax=Acer negundo TaxID=4023 RepID=A0AAD5NNL4_ACENE|nr:hypothetical protein LWI28_018289 [Acer negundo]
MGTMPEAYPHLMLNNFKTKVSLSLLANSCTYWTMDSVLEKFVTISFLHHIYEKSGGPKSIELKEIGPRFELRLYQVKLGTVYQSEAQVEWVIRPYMNTSKKRKFLGD